jgi:ATP-binding cassette subfamily B protein/subfamily B ATP-binding cassette protein MsbA
MARPTSRRRFAEYRERVRSKGDRPSHGRAHDDSKQRARSFFELFRAFLLLLRGHRTAIVIALATLTLATLIKLLPPVSLKLAIDYVLPDKPLPVEWSEQYHLPTDRVQLLFLIGSAVIATSLVASIIHLWGRRR